MAFADDLIQLCREFIGIESLSGKEERAAAFLTRTMLSLGYDEVRTDRLGSVIGKINGKGNGPALLFDGHMDTVPVSDPDQWTVNPFGGDILQGRIYGRGATDMKGALSAMVAAVAQLKRSGIQPEGDIYVSATVCEEIFEGVALKEVMDAVGPELVVIGEATGLDLHIGQRGRAEIKVTSHGKTAHSSNPEQGTNAITRILPFLDKLQGRTPPRHVQLGEGISVVTDVISSPFPGCSVIPDKCTVTIDRRLLAGEEEESVLREHRSLAADVSVEIAEQSAACYTGEVIASRRFYPAWLMEVDHPVVQLALKALHHQGIASRISTYQFCTNGSYSAGVANVPTIGFGPSFEHLAHTADEYIEIDQLIQSAKGYYAIAKAWAIRPTGEPLAKPI